MYPAAIVEFDVLKSHSAEPEEMHLEHQLIKITRTPPVYPLSDSGPSESDLRLMHSTLGGEEPWNWAVPLLYRVLASPQARLPMPSRPEADGSFLPGRGYWNLLIHLLSFSLGWRDPGKGLRWWYDAGKPDDSPQLAVLKAVWDRDGELDKFVAAASEENYSPFVLLGLDGEHSEKEDLTPKWSRFVISQQNAGASALNDPASMHLQNGSHAFGPLRSTEGRVRLLRSGPIEGAAILLLDNAPGWYKSLHEESAKLPQKADGSWRVDVVSKPLGYVGTYRKSRRTGYWFSGPHRYHTPGN